MTATDRAYKTARRLRRELSLPEKLLWARLRNAPVRFRRQHPIGPYVLDFYCPAQRLAVEIDGFAHDTGERPERDEVRTEWLRNDGIDIVRIAAREVLDDPDRVAEALLRLCSKPLHQSASPIGPPPHACGAGRSE